MSESLLSFANMNWRAQMENVRTMVLEEASDLINGHREADYGSPARSFDRIAAMWAAYLGHDIEARDVCIMMALLKVGRLSNGHHWDSVVDAAGYMALSAEVSVE